MKAWQILEQRIAIGPGAIQIPTDEVLPELHKELRGVRRKPTPDGGYQIVDKNRKVRHADVADGLAGCCLLAYLQQTRRGSGLDGVDLSDGRKTSSFKSSGLAGMISGKGKGDWF